MCGVRELGRIKLGVGEMERFGRRVGMNGIGEHAESIME